MTIKFQKHAIVDTAHDIKCRVSYGHYTGARDGKKYAVIYAKDYGSGLGCIFPDDYENNTDSQTDYFEKTTVRFVEGHPLYEAVLDMNRKLEAAFEMKQAKRIAKFAAQTF